jgi:hypothetical protein
MFRMVSAHHAPIGPPIRGPTMYGIISDIASVPQRVITVAKRSPRSLAGLMLALENISPRSSCTRVGEKSVDNHLDANETYPVNGPKSTIMAPIARATIGGTAGPGMGYSGLVTIKMINRRKAVPNASMNKAWY